MGIESSGMIVLKALKNAGFWVYGSREFPSLIKGGRASMSINFSSNHPVNSSQKEAQIGIAFDREGLLEALESTKSGGIIILGFERWNKVVKNLPNLVAAKNIQLITVPARELALENGGNIVMTNIVLLGVLWQILGLDLEIIKAEVTKQFSKKASLLELNFQCLASGYNFTLPEIVFEKPILPTQNNTKNHLIIDGNSSIGLGAIHGGAKNYYAYPMSPASSILIYLAKIAQKYGMVVKQAEDEITAAQMALGSSFAGQRSFTATSGGGFDLMTETVSLSAMTETPLVIVISQRPGPATGLPTWTGQSDLNLAIHSGHGEFSRIVLACSDPISCFENIQLAFNFSEEFQLPVILLTEADIAMSYFTTPDFTQNNIRITRGLVEVEKLNEVKSTDRFKLTENGVSPRWLTGETDQYYYANGDEHWNRGELTEDGEKTKLMIEKRNLKAQAILDKLPKPEIFGEKDAEFSFVGWGSTKNIMLDCIEYLRQNGIKASYLHYNFLWPLDTQSFVDFYQENIKTILVEGNFVGQLGQLLEEKTGLKFDQKILKYNGRPFWLEDILEALNIAK